MSFEARSDISAHPAFSGDRGPSALGLWTPCGSWTAANGKTGVVPREVAEALAYGDKAIIAKLVDGGMWRVTDDGFEMRRGPGSELPRPLWRYSD